jgi:hypothetical protein
MDNPYRDTGNIEHTRQDEDKQSTQKKNPKKQPTTQHNTTQKPKKMSNTSVLTSADSTCFFFVMASFVADLHYSVYGLSTEHYKYG